LAHNVKQTRETLKAGAHKGAEQIAKARGNSKAEQGSGGDKVK